MRIRNLLFAFPLLVALAGCVSEPIPEVRTNLIVTRSGSDVAIQWQSAVGKTYTVLYTESIAAGNQWKILPGAERIKGTGRLIQLSDSPPAGHPRYYDLHVEVLR